MNFRVMRIKNATEALQRLDEIVRDYDLLDSDVPDSNLRHEIYGYWDSPARSVSVIRSELTERAQPIY